jgi:hypothetical protein
MEGGVEVMRLLFLNLALRGGEWSASRACCTISGEAAPFIGYVGDCLGPRVGLDFIE